uniref:C2H2-type domain-containing protein n=1 Tax=Opuntia streptacantha TaxID=393608 RepID=A0A7C9EI37_OPUST
MDFELRRAREKLQREQKERKEKAKLKLERERKAKEEAARLRDALEAVQRARRLDVAQAQLKAEQQMAESLLSGGGIVFSLILDAVPYPGIGDKIKLPPSCFTALSDQGAFDKGPVYFRLSVAVQEVSSDVGAKESHSVTHSGVLEFTAEEGTVALPPHVWSNLFGSELPMAALVEVQYVRLPKGSYAKLQPEEPGFFDVPNHKAVLETTLRQHATLSQDDTITVRHGGLTFKLHVLELKPSSSVSVLETDIEVDIVNPVSSSEESNQNILKPLAFGTPESGFVEEGQYVYYKFTLDNDIWNIIASENSGVEVKLETETDSGDTDLYIAKHPLMFPTHHQHQWSSHDMGSKALILSSQDQNLSQGSYSIGIYGFKGKTVYKISVSLQDNSNRGQQAGVSTSAADVDSVQCGNCNHYIPSRSIALHEAFCRRHNVICQHPGCGVVLRVDDAKNHVHCNKCGKAFQQAEIEKHIKVFHEPIHCSCGVVLEKEEMVQHQSTDCPMRMITCRFCGDVVQAGSSAVDMRDRMRGLSEHESICGSRTAPCDSCGRAVMLKDMDIHRIAVHPNN